MFKRYGCTIAVALLAAGAGAGCGGDDEEPLSKAEYIKQGDAICKKAQAEGEKDVEEMFGDLGANEEPSEEQLKTLVDDVLKPNTEGQLEELRDLPAPEGDEETLNGIYDGAEEALEKIEDDPMILLSEDDPFEKASQEAEDYGFEECSN
jgi:Tfp pilus assembly protein FimV